MPDQLSAVDQAMLDVFRNLVAARGPRSAAVGEFLRSLAGQHPEAAAKAASILELTEKLNPQPGWARWALGFVTGLPPGAQRLLVGAGVTVLTVLGVKNVPGGSAAPGPAPAPTEENLALVEKAVQNGIANPRAERFFAPDQLKAQVIAAAAKSNPPADKAAVERQAAVIAQGIKDAWTQQK